MQFAFRLFCLILAVAMVAAPFGEKLTKEDILHVLIANTEENLKEYLTSLHVAITLGDYDACVMLLDAGTNPNLADIDGATSLHYAVAARHLDIVNLLLERKVFVNEKDKKGKTALYMAAQLGYTEIVKTLLFNNGGRLDVNAVDAMGWTPYHAAAHGGYEEVIEILATTHMNRTVYEHTKKMSPLHVAVAADRTEAVARLIDCPEMMESIDASGMTSLHYAAQMGRKVLLQMMMNAGAELSIRDTSGNTIMHAACNISGQVQDRLPTFRLSAEIVAILLLNSRVDPRKENVEGKRAMDVALTKGNFLAYEVLRKEMLIRGGDRSMRHPLHREILDTEPDMNFIQQLLLTEDANWKDHLGQTVAHLAVKTENVEVVSVLINSCDLKLKDAAGNVPLHYAKSVKMARVLLKGDAETANIQNDIGNTPLLMAITDGFTEVACFLAPRTSRIDARNLRFRSALVLAAAGGNLPIVECLLANGAGSDSPPRSQKPLHYAAFYGHFHVAMALVKAGHKTRDADTVGVLPVYLAIANGGNLDLIRLLLQGVEPDYTDAAGRSLLHRAVLNKKPGIEDVIKLLVGYGVPLDTICSRGLGALHVAVKKSYVQTVRTFLENGADIFLQTVKGETALHIAVQNDWGLIVSMLLNADRRLLGVADFEGFTPVDRLLGYDSQNMRVQEVWEAMALTEEELQEYGRRGWKSTSSRWNETVKSFKEAVRALM